MRNHLLPPVIIILILLAAREVSPNVAAQIAPVYTFLDKILLPIINWVFGLVNNLILGLFQIGAA